MNKYHDFFHEYVAGYDTKSTWIWHKHEHTIRVADNCRVLADDLKFNAYNTDLAELIGLFHDIGRFEQWRVYQSFSDDKTIDHADLGVKIIKDNGILTEHPDYDLICLAIYNHNKFKIDTKITDDRELTFCKLIRDADKLDIIREFVTGDLKLPQDGETYSIKALNEIAAHKLLDRKIHVNSIDVNLTALALFNDIYFDYTRRCIREEFLIEKIVELYIKSDPAQTNLFRQLEKFIKEQY